MAEHMLIPGLLALASPYPALSATPLGSSPVQTALLVGGAVAVASAMVGLFTVVRGQSFAGHALGDVGTAGGSVSYLFGLDVLVGFVGIALITAALMDLFGIDREEGRDVATGVVLGSMLGVGALLLYLDSTLPGSSGSAMVILFGSLFSIPGAAVPFAIMLSMLVAGGVGLLFRPLLLDSVNSDLARASGIRRRVVGRMYLLLLALGIALSSLTIGAILSTALLVGPAAAAAVLFRRPLHAFLAAVAVSVLSVWAGIFLSYYSYYWPPYGHGWPVSFFVVAIIFATYLGARGYCQTLGRRTGSIPGPLPTLDRGPL